MSARLDSLTSWLRPDLDVPEPPRPGAVVLAAAGLGLRVDGRWLLRDVDLELRAGEVLAVVGPNGAGKSTLLSLLAADVTPTAGTVHLRGLAVGAAHPTQLARRRAVLVQRPELAFPFTVRAVVAMGRAPWQGTTAEDDDDRVIAQSLDTADVTQLSSRSFPTLSGGEQARASFARVLAQRTSALLLDEPTAALDLRHQEELMTSAGEWAAAGHAVLVVLHDLQLAAAHADRIAVLGAGRLAAIGDPEAVLTETLLSEVYELPIEVLRHPGTDALLIGPRRPPRPALSPSRPARRKQP